MEEPPDGEAVAEESEWRVGQEVGGGGEVEGVVLSWQVLPSQAHCVCRHLDLYHDAFSGNILLLTCP